GSSIFSLLDSGRLERLDGAPVDCSSLRTGRHAGRSTMTSHHGRSADQGSLYLVGLTTSALPPPRRTGSAAASVRLPRRNSMPVAAPISAGAPNEWPRAFSAAASGVCRKAASTELVEPLRWLTRGSAIA